MFNAMIFSEDVNKFYDADFEFFMIFLIFDSVIFQEFFGLLLIMYLPITLPNLLFHNVGQWCRCCLFTFRRILEPSLFLVFFLLVYYILANCTTVVTNGNSVSGI